MQVHPVYAGACAPHGTHSGSMTNKAYGNASPPQPTSFAIHRLRFVLSHTLNALVSLHHTTHTHTAQTPRRLYAACLSCRRPRTTVLNSRRIGYMWAKTRCCLNKAWCRSGGTATSGGALGQAARMLRSQVRAELTLALIVMSSTRHHWRWYTSGNKGCALVHLLHPCLAPWNLSSIS